MKHNPALSTKNVRTACSKLTWNVKVTGNAKASWLRQAKERRIAAPCVVYTGEALATLLKGN